jgi:hypothetical protein
MLIAESWQLKAQNQSGGKPPHAKKGFEPKGLHLSLYHWTSPPRREKPAADSQFSTYSETGKRRRCLKHAVII